jgi:tRNA-2-methylthio-N6-dimethylallyladenosine synthase
VVTFGCQMNEHDSERLAGLLEGDGLVAAASPDDADVMVLNTCCIRENADNKLYGNLGQLKRWKGERDGRQIVVAGCLAQKDQELVRQRAPQVDVVLGTHNVHRVTELMARARTEGPVTEILQEAVADDRAAFPSALPVRREQGYTAWVTIQIGCDNSCAFCIVPAVRGREISRPFAELVAEVEALAAAGVTEVTLLGQNVNSYGRDLPKDSRITFAELLTRVDAVPGIDRIRYTSPHPKDMKEDVIRAHAELPALCEQIHLPLQSGSSTVLKRMRRTYNRERYMDRVALIREHVPDCAITTDIIVGFPGETERDFAETLEVAEEVAYDGAFTFIFSPRRETEAATMDGQLTHPVKVERMERLVEVVQRRATERSQRFVGRTMEVLVEGPSRTDPTRLRGRTRHNKAVNFEGVAEPGEMVDVTIESATSQTLSGVAARPLSPLL